VVVGPVVFAGVAAGLAVFKPPKRLELPPALPPNNEG
jgi:hypothetical protein